MLLDRQWKLTVRDSALVRGRIIQVCCLFLEHLQVHLFHVDFQYVRAYFDCPYCSVVCMLFTIFPPPHEYGGSSVNA